MQRPASGWHRWRIIGGVIAGRQILGVPWGVAFVPLALVAVVAFALLGRASDSSVGARPTPSTSTSTSTSTVPDAVATAPGLISDVVGHSWQRPYAVTPDLQQWPSGFLRLAPGVLDFGPEPGPAASRSDMTVVGPDSLVLTATAQTQGCAIGDVGVYRWLLEGKGTVLTLTPFKADGCAARETALTGQWVRSDLPAPGAPEALLPAGPHVTSAFDPFGDAGASRQLSYAVPPGWQVLEDGPASFVLLYQPDRSQGQRVPDSFVFLLAQPRMTAESEPGAQCGPAGEAPGAGHGVDDIVAAIVARPGVASTHPADVTIGGYAGRMLDLHLAPSWTGRCQTSEDLIVGLPILVAGSGAGPTIGIGTDHPLRLILLDLGDDRTMSIAIAPLEASLAGPALPLEDQVRAVMPVIESFQFHVPPP